MSKHSSIARSTASSIRTEDLKCSPPWTIRWPTASISARSRMTPLPGRVSSARILSTAILCSRISAVSLTAGTPSAS